jgi:hypothetical protein
VHTVAIVLTQIQATHRDLCSYIAIHNYKLLQTQNSAMLTPMAAGIPAFLVSSFSGCQNIATLETSSVHYDIEDVLRTTAHPFD